MIEIHDYPSSECGLGVTFNHVVWQMLQHPGEKYWVNIDKGSSPYREKGHGPNPWDYYFLQSPPEHPLTQIEPPQSLALSGHHAWSLVYQNAIRDRVTPHIKLRPEIQAEVDSFRRQHFKGKVMGLYLRGTDKFGEYKTMSDKDIVMHVRALKERWNPDTIFLATDDVDMHRLMQPFKAVSTTIARSKLSLHHYPPNGPYLSGKQALIDAWLLAACNFLAFTPSNFATIPLIMGRHEDLFCINKHCVITAFIPQVDSVLGLEQKVACAKSPQ